MHYNYIITNNAILGKKNSSEGNIRLIYILSKYQYIIYYQKNYLSETNKIYYAPTFI